MRTVAALSERIAARPVLVLGKGPSLSRESFELHHGGSYVIGVNQTVRTFKCDAAFFIDIEPFLESIPELMSSRAAVILPQPRSVDFPETKHAGQAA